MDKEMRNRILIKSGFVGISVNFFLFVLKFICGNILGSIAVISDAFNNLTDVGTSSVIVIGTKMSAKEADKGHPYGHGRIEYIASLIVSILIIIFGVELMRSSILEIFKPEKIKFNLILIIFLSISILFKIFLFIYFIAQGRKTNSGILKAVGVDSLSDILTTIAVIAATIIQEATEIAIDGYVGGLIALLIIWNGVKLSKETIDTLIGTPPPQGLIDDIESIIGANEKLLGYHRLRIHDYGHGLTIGSVDAELPRNMTVHEAHRIVDKLEDDIFEETGIKMTIHADPRPKDSDIQAAETEENSADKNSEFDFDFNLKSEENSANMNSEFDFDFNIKTEENSADKNGEFDFDFNLKTEENSADKNGEFDFDFNIKTEENSADKNGEFNDENNEKIENESDIKNEIDNEISQIINEIIGSESSGNA
ncbi:MAG: cation diffusion facilitator family transporter [Ruminococcus sp.]|jgi:cation diffusion facilitator family transporter|nr:cation diffusion facilitator family transporter [Ruminococcus sp.]